MNWKCRFYIWLKKRKNYKEDKKSEKRLTHTRVKEIIENLAWYGKCHKRLNRIEHLYGYKSLVSAAKYLGLEAHLTFEGN